MPPMPAMPPAPVPPQLQQQQQQEMETAVALPWSPQPQLTVGWLKGLFWQVVPQHLSARSMWRLPPPHDWQELLQEDFWDLDRNWRTGTAVAVPPVFAVPTSQTSLIEARRTQNIEIMLRRIPGSDPLDKAAFVLEIMQKTLCMRASEFKNSMLAIRQVILSRSIERSSVQPPESAQGPSQRLNSMLAVLGPDLVIAVLGRQLSVRNVLHFAETCRESYSLAHSGSVWRSMYAGLLPQAMAGDDIQSEASTAQLSALYTAVELLVENPLLLVPTREECDALQWYAGDQSRLAPSNVFLMALANSRGLSHIRRSLGVSSNQDVAAVFAEHMNAMRTLFRAEHITECCREAIAGVRCALASDAIASILLAVREIANCLNRSHRPAFRINSLLSLRLLSCNDSHKGMTLLHYLVALLRARAPEALDFVRPNTLDVLDAAVRALQRLEAVLPKLVKLWQSLPQPFSSTGPAPATTTTTSPATTRRGRLMREDSDPRELLLDDSAALRTLLAQVHKP
jgi:hypothetical protein